MAHVKISGNSSLALLPKMARGWKTGALRDDINRYKTAEATYNPFSAAALAREHFDEGSPVSFGTVTVSKQGVYDGHELYSWNYIVDVQPADNGILVTENSFGTPRTFTLPITTPQDIQTCMGLIRRRLK